MKRLAIIVPWFSFFLREKYTQGFICLALQITVIGWPIATLWAMITLLTSKEKDGNQGILYAFQPTFDISGLAVSGELGMKGIA
jgi:hypothetical protein